VRTKSKGLLERPGLQALDLYLRDLNPGKNPQRNLWGVSSSTKEYSSSGIGSKNSSQIFGEPGC